MSLLLTFLMLSSATSLADVPVWLPEPPRSPEQARDQDKVVASLLGDIMGYVRWPAAPVPPAPLRLCTMGPLLYARELRDIRLSSGQGVRVRALAGPSSIGKDACDALYFGGLKAIDQRRLRAGLRNLPVLTIAEDDEECRGGAMICLHIGAASTGFELNINAVTHGTVRIDPRVLRLSRGHEEVK
ncbi:YfiR family protein [Sphingobium sp. H39-3-25]|uniref:YfiR family protein n=1 Tax=Sphingobium arseniciresistens TaxID=3030834 RepID=UPI0023B8B03B|nr:YfiR family protein [Sphingobium arseniciresistens]